MDAKVCRKGLHRYDSGLERCPKCRLASRIRYGQSEKGRAVRARYEETRIRVTIADMSWSYRVPPEKKAELQERLAEFRAEQRSAYRHNGPVRP